MVALKSRLAAIGILRQKWADILLPEFFQKVIFHTFLVLSLPNAYLYYIPIGILIGFGKALRTIFMALVIPSYVPLTRLPAATGLQLLTTGMFCLGFGPAFGKIF